MTAIMLGILQRRSIHRYLNVPVKGVYKKTRWPENTAKSSPFHSEDPSLYDIFPRVGVTPATRRRPIDDLRADRQTNLLTHRVQLLLAQEKQHEQIKQVLAARAPKPHKVKRNKAEMSRLTAKDEKYYLNKGILGPEQEVSKYFEVDEVTGLPYGLGFDQDLQMRRDNMGQSTEETQFQSIARELGLRTIEEARSRVSPPDMTLKLAAIRKKLYTQPNPTADTYKNIEFKQDPRSKQKDLNAQEEIFPEDFSDEEAKMESNPYAELDEFIEEKLREEEALGTEPVLARTLDFVGLENGMDEDDGEPDMNYNPESLYWDEQTRSFMEKVAEQRVSKPVWSRVRELARLKEQATRMETKLFDTRGRQDSKLWSEKMKLFSPSEPSLKDVLQEADIAIATGPKGLRILLNRDEYEGNYHFKPRYLHKDFHSDDFGWAFEHCKNLETINSGVISGEISPRVGPEELTLMENAMRKAHHAPFELGKENEEAVMLYGLIQKDPYYSHYLDNHLRFWKERMTQDVLTMTARVDAGHTKPFEMIPWESVLINKKSDLTIPPKKIRKPDENERTHAYGSRKCARAYAYLVPGTGRITINDKSLIDYFSQIVYRNRIVRPFLLTGTMCEFDLKLVVNGGGSSAQSQACCLATARALAVYGNVFEKTLRVAKALKVNPRQVERKKTGRYKARKSYTFVKR